jgi:hypothetical protein
MGTSSKMVHGNLKEKQSKKSTKQVFWFQKNAAD